jgi:hypothetical protein
MVESRERDMSKVLANVEQEMTQHPIPVQRTSPQAVEAFAPQKYRNPSGDSMEQIQQDFRKVVTELEQRFKVLADELKRITG